MLLQSHWPEDKNVEAYLLDASDHMMVVVDLKVCDDMILFSVMIPRVKLVNSTLAIVLRRLNPRAKQEWLVS
jgi:hypothetical protein